MRRAVVIRPAARRTRIGDSEDGLTDHFAERAVSLTRTRLQSGFHLGGEAQRQDGVFRGGGLHGVFGGGGCTGVVLQESPGRQRKSRSGKNHHRGGSA